MSLRNTCGVDATHTDDRRNSDRVLGSWVTSELLVSLRPEWPRKCNTRVLPLAARRLNRIIGANDRVADPVASRGRIAPWSRADEAPFGRGRDRRAAPDISC